MNDNAIPLPHPVLVSTTADKSRHIRGCVMR